MRASQPAFNSFCFRFSFSWSSSSFNVLSEAHVGGVVLSYLGVRNVHQGEVCGLVLVQGMNARDRHCSRAYRFLVTIFLLALLEASFKLLDGEVESTFVLKTFSIEYILHWDK